jgi:TldD protein
MFDEAKVLAGLAAGDVLYAETFEEETASTQIQLESEKVEKLEKGVDSGVGLRAIRPWQTFFASTNSREEGHLVDLAKELVRTLPAAGSPGRAGEADFQLARYPFLIMVPPGDVEVQKKLGLVRSVENAARKMEKRIRQVKVLYRDVSQHVRIAGSDGTRVEDKRTQLVLTLLVVGEEAGELQTAYEAIGGFCGFEFFTEERIETFVRSTVARLAGLLSAMEAPMGAKTVVLASEAGGTMIHEAVGHGLEADLAMEGLSCYKGMLGQSIASPLVDVVDDKTLAFRRGAYAYDDEGTVSERTVLIEKGVLKSYLFDRFHAMKYGVRSTANGRRESFRFKPIPRMSNTLILPGHADPEAIIASVDSGVLVRKMGGGQVDTVRGDFVFEIQEGYLIEKGRIGPMVRNATMMGNGPKALKDIDMVGNDLGFGIGTCGKDDQGVPIADAQPTLRIPEIIVGGKGG